MAQIKINLRKFSYENGKWTELFPRSCPVAGVDISVVEDSGTPMAV
jgi:hypothetical protein